MEPKKKKRGLLIGGIAAAAVLAYSSFVLIAGGNKIKAMNPITISSAAVASDTTEKSVTEALYEAEAEETARQLQTLTNASRFSFSINSNPEIIGGGEATLFIRNGADNTVGMRVRIALRDSGETIYQSRLLAPGESINREKLTATLTPGEHAAVAYIIPEDEAGNPLASLEADLTLTVHDGEESAHNA